MTIFQKTAATFAHFARQQRGSIATTFALALIPMTLSVGAAVDYSFANGVKAKLDALADAAALTAVNKSAMGLTIATARQNALKIFNGQATSITRATVGTVTATLTDSGTTRSVVVTYEATVPTSILGVMGVSTLALKGESKASSAIPTYIDFYLLLDNTPSMGVAATPADVTRMVNNTPDQCAFACHDLSDPNNYYKLAKTLGVTMRIDVLRSATQQLMDTATATRATSDQFRMAIYTFGSSCVSLGLSAITSLTSNLANAKTAAANIDLMTIPYQGYYNDQCTNYDLTMPAMNSLISTPGTGDSSASPQKILFFVSDGVADANNPLSCSRPLTGGTRCQEPIDLALCDSIKRRGIKIAGLYTTYLPLPTNSWYNTWIAPFSSQIGPRMQSCASPGLYFEVSPTQGISDAMTTLFQKVVAQARLTQ